MGVAVRCGVVGVRGMWVYVKGGVGVGRVVVGVGRGRQELPSVVGMGKIFPIMVCGCGEEFADCVGLAV